MGVMMAIVSIAVPVLVVQIYAIVIMVNVYLMEMNNEIIVGPSILSLVVDVYTGLVISLGKTMLV